MLSLRTLSNSQIWLGITLVIFIIFQAPFASAKPAWKDDPTVEQPKNGSKKGGGKNKTRTAVSDILITEHPSSITLTEGDQAIFNVSASSSDGQAISYQWYFAGQAINGASTQNYTIGSTLISNQGEYTVSLSTTDVSKTTFATLVVEPITPPETDLVVSFHPMSQSAYVNDSLTLNVSAMGSGDLQYQWRKNGLNISGANLEHLYFDSLTLNESGQYDVVVSNEMGFVVSNTASIDIKTLPSIALSWDTPTLREDGSVLTLEEIGSFNIYVSFENETLEEVISVNGTSNSIDLNDVPAGAYNFAIATVDSSGITGSRSESISVIVN